MRKVLFALLTFSSLGQAQKNYKGAEIYSNEAVLYGKFEFRMKTVQGSGLLSSFFLYKNDSYISGVYWEEIDVELLGKSNATFLSTNIITDGVSAPAKYSNLVYELPVSLSADYHTYTLEWTPTYISWMIDGTEYRRETGAVVQNLTKPESYRFNSWISSADSWVGPFSETALPQRQYIDWIQYSSYSNGTFQLKWRDDFTTFDSQRWSKADWTFDGNLTDLVSNNAYIENGNLVLAVTKSSATTALNQSTTDNNQVELGVDKDCHQLRIGTKTDDNKAIKLYDLGGKVCYRTTNSSGSTTIDYSSLKAGIYILSIESESGRFIQKVNLVK